MNAVAEIQCRDCASACLKPPKIELLVFWAENAEISLGVSNVKKRAGAAEAMQQGDCQAPT